MHVQRAALQPVGLHLQEALLQRGGVQRCVVGWHGRRGNRRKFCSQLVVASIMIGRLCKVLWACAVQRRGRGGGGRRRANEDEEGVSQGGRSGVQSTHAFATTHERRLGAQAG